MPVIVDEAWGPHLPFHPELPMCAMDAGADVRVTSVHTMGSGREQGSVFPLQGARIGADALADGEDGVGRAPGTAALGISAERAWFGVYGRGRRSPSGTPAGMLASLRFLPKRGVTMTFPYRRHDDGSGLTDTRAAS